MEIVNCACARMGLIANVPPVTLHQDNVIRYVAIEPD